MTQATSNTTRLSDTLTRQRLSRSVKIGLLAWLPVSFMSISIGSSRGIEEYLHLIEGWGHDNTSLFVYTRLHVGRKLFVTTHLSRPAATPTVAHQSERASTKQKEAGRLGDCCDRESNIVE